MIFVFVVDTSPSMGQPALQNSSLSRLDVAKMAVEDFHRQWRKLRNAPVRTSVQNTSVNAATTLLGPLGQLPTQEDQFLLLSTSRQHADTALCAAGGRLLVGFPPPAQPNWLTHNNDGPAEAFQRELKQLKVATVDPSSSVWLDEWGGASGLNIALSTGLELLSRYRLMNKHTEHFGMGRLPNNSIMMNAAGSSTHVVQVVPAMNALQPACLVLLTDGACLRLSERQGGGSLQLHYGSQPLRELYQEPFRWDQRIFIQAVGVTSNMTSTQYLHPQLRALSEVTGGAHFIVKWNGNVQSSTDMLLKHICPPMPLSLPLPDPLYKRLGTPSGMSSYLPIALSGNAFFINGGPIASFHCLEDSTSEKKSTGQRALLLYVGSSATQNPQGESSAVSLSPPLFCIAESYFPSKMLDTLPPRSAQPKLYYSRYPAVFGSKSFVPMQVIQQLHRLDQLLTSNHKRKGATTPVRLLHRDVYICDWRDAEGGTVKSDPPLPSNVPEYVPVFVPGAGRPSLSEDGENILNIGILNVAPVTPTSTGHNPNRGSAGNHTTLTLLPPEPQILLPLLLRVAEQEHRAWKKSVEGNPMKSAASADAPPTKVHISIDESWKSEFRAYLFRIPPYYHNAVKRCLRPILPSSVHNLLHLESMDAIVSQCFSKVCHQKIRNGELIAKEYAERMERQETMIRFNKTGAVSSVDAAGPVNDADLHPKHQKVGHYDPRCSTDSYLASLRSIPAPWRLFGSNYEPPDGTKTKKEPSATLGSQQKSFASPTSALDDLGDLPADCLLAFYESRRRWIFGGPGLTIRGLHVEGVPNDGSNSQRRGNVASGETNDQYDCLLSIGGVGASTLNQTTTTKMGEYRERLLFSRSPVVGYGSNDAAGVSATTAIDGSPKWSVDDDAMPLAFFDPKTGEFEDSTQARVRSKLMVNFGNPYKEKRADSLIPEKFLSQTPSLRQGGFGSTSTGNLWMSPSPTSSDSFDSVEEGEAIFVLNLPSKRSPKREEADTPLPPEILPAKRPRSDSDDTMDSVSSTSVGSESKKSQAPVIPPPPRPRPPAPKSKLATKSSKLPPPPPSRPKSGVPPPPPPLAAVKKVPPLIQPIKIQPPPPKPPKSELAVSSCEAASSSSSTGGFELTQSLDPTEESGTALSNDEPSLKPSVGEEDALATVSHAIAAIASVKTDILVLDDESNKPDVALPTGWMCVWSKSQKRWYFFDTKTNKSVWNWPP